MKTGKRSVELVLLMKECPMIGIWMLFRIYKTTIVIMERKILCLR